MVWTLHGEICDIAANFAFRGSVMLRVYATLRLTKLKHLK